MREKKNRWCYERNSANFIGIVLREKLAEIDYV